MPKRVDGNQVEIVRALRQVGATVTVTSDLGKGFPDIVVGYRGLNHLLEIKDGRRPPSARKLTTDEMVFHQMWRGSVITVCDVDEALRAIGAIQ